MSEHNLYKELLRLQRIEDAFDSWKEYREKVTEYIIKNVDCFDSIVIFGAGSCSDIDLSIIENHFEEVVLVDIDYHSMNEGIKKYCLEKSKKIKVLKVDLLGIEEKDYKKFSKDLEKSGADRDLAIKDLEQYHSIIISNDIKKLKNSKYKNGVVIGLHSQLNINFANIYEIYCEALHHSPDISVFNQIIKMNKDVVKKINDIILNCVEDNIFFGFETEIISAPGKKIEGAYQAEEDFKKRNDKGEIDYKELGKLAWPLREKLEYNMSIVKISLSTK